MEEVWTKLHSSYLTAVEERADSRTKEWPMVHSPWSPILVVIMYNLFCWNAKRLTSGLPKFNLRPVIVVYNFAMVLASLYMTYEFFVTAYLSHYNLTCQPIDYTMNPLALRMASVCWCYYFSKYVELLETVFFALRKKYSQISVLHIYHHSSMIIIWWLGIKYVPGGQSFLFGLINSFVHAVMYTYYGLSAIGRHMQRYLWWKKYITMIQLSQFFILAIFTINNMKVQCDFPTWLNKLLFVYAITLGVLFFNFYTKAYNQSQKKEEGMSSCNGNGIHEPSENDLMRSDKKIKSCKVKTS